MNIKLVYIISGLVLGGAQTLLLDIINNINKTKEFDITVINFKRGEFVDVYKRAGINVIDMNFNGLINFRIVPSIKKILKEIKPDIVHTHLHKADFYGRIAAKQAKVPIIISTCHNYTTSHKKISKRRKLLTEYIDDLVSRYSKSYEIAISKKVYEYLIERNKYFKGRTYLIYNGINPNKANLILNESEKIIYRSELSLNKNDFIISIIGRIDVQKGHKLFIEALSNLIFKNENIKILIVIIALF